MCVDLFKLRFVSGVVDKWGVERIWMDFIVGYIKYEYVFYLKRLKFYI